MRISEALGLRWGDIHLNANPAYIEMLTDRYYSHTNSLSFSDWVD